MGTLFVISHLSRSSCSVHSPLQAGPSVSAWPNRVSTAHLPSQPYSNLTPAKERSGFGGSGGFDDEKFAGNWRREGPLPDLPSSRDGSRRRFDGPSPREPPPPSVSDNISDWRSSRPPARAPPPMGMGPPDEGPGFRRRGSGFRSDGPGGPADSEETWSKGSRFTPGGPPEGPGSRYGSMRGGREGFGGAPPPAGEEESDWRRPRTMSRNSTSRTCLFAIVVNNVTKGSA